MSNLDIWNKHADIHPRFTKPITGKQYKGTSPSPQHVVWCLTDLFGPAGKGWGYTVVAEGFQPLGDEVLHWCRIEFWHGDRANSFQQYGQTKAMMKTRNGLMTDEDAPKKSITDALVKCASYVGVAANIFLGRWDDAKYVQQAAAQIESRERASKPRTLADDEGANARLVMAGRASGLDGSQVVRWVQAQPWGAGVTGWSAIPADHADDVQQYIIANAKQEVTE